MLVKCPKKLDVDSYGQKMYFQDPIFQQDNASVHKPKIIGNFLQEKEWKVLERPLYSPYQKFMGDFEAPITKTVFWENLE